MKAIKVYIRWMISRDFEEVMEIERDGFRQPWSENDFRRCLKQRNCIGMVAEHDERIAGFMVYELHKAKLHILNLAVRVGYRRRSVGVQMLDKIKGKLSNQRRSRLMLEVRETNLDAQLFFRSQGFRAVNVLHDIYDDTDEAAYLMVYKVGAAIERDRVEALRCLE